MNLVKFVTKAMLPNFRPVRSATVLSRVWYGSNIKSSEQDLTNTLRTKFPSASDIRVTDISGGCGAMFDVFVESADFKGMSLVRQHMTVNEALKEQIKDMHGIRIVTSVPKSN